MNPTNIKQSQIKKATDEAYAFPASDEIMNLIIKELEINPPSLIVEIGTGYGISTAVFAMAFENAKIITFEKSLERHQKALAYFDTLKLKNIEAFHQDAKEALFPPSIDVAFIDASKANHQQFLEKILKKLNPDGVVFIDNMQISRIHTEKTTRSRRALIKKHDAFMRWLDKQTDLSVNHLDIHDGLAIIRFK